MLHRIRIGYLATGAEQKLKGLIETLVSLFEQDRSLKQVFVHFSLLLIIATYPGWNNNLLPIFNGSMHYYYKDDAKMTQFKFEQSFVQTVFKLLQQQKLFDTKDCLPVLLIASAKSASTLVADQAKSFINTLQLDTEDLDMSAFIYSMIFGRFEMFFHAGEGSLIQQPPFDVQKHLLYYLLKFPGAISQSPFNLNLVDHCLFNAANIDQMQTEGLMFVRMMLRNDPDMSKATMQHLHHVLTRVIAAAEFRPESKALAYLLMAELAAKDYDLVLNNEITLAVETFNALRERVQVCEADLK